MIHHAINWIISQMLALLTVLAFGVLVVIAGQIYEAYYDARIGRKK